MISDLHVHSIWSSDCLVPAEEQIEKALSLGMKHICITDHNDYDAPVFLPDYFNFLIDDKGDEDSLNRYASALHSLKEKYAGRIEVLAGIELGMQPHLAEKLTKLVEEYSFDMVIGSTHSFEGMDAEDPRHYKDIPVEKAIGNYFEEELKT